MATRAVRWPLKPICYVETNYLIGVSRGQLVSEDHAENLVRDVFPDLRVVIPEVCFMEALKVMEEERKGRAQFHIALEERARQARRDHVFDAAPALAGYLEQAIIASDEHLGMTELCLWETLASFAADAELIPLNFDLVDRFLDYEYLGDPSDNLILHCICDHARAHPQGKKAFVTEDVHFKEAKVVEFLKSRGIRHFQKVESALGWLKASNPPDPSGG
jgi:predicted nucleic acid-binding protein